MDEDYVQPVEETTETGGVAQNAEGKAPVTPVDEGKINFPENTSTSDTNQRKRKRKPLSSFEIWTIVLGSVGILVAGGTGLAIILQDKIASKTLAELQKQYPQLKKSADAADSASHTAQDAVEASAKQFRQDERPYVWAYAVASPNNVVLPALGERIFIRVDFKNSGRTPATNLIPTQSETIVAPKDEARRQAREFIARYPTSPGMVFPPEITGTAPTGYGPELSETLLANIKNDDWEIYVVGAVKYTDVFQPPITPYETIYCFSFQPSGLPFGGCKWGGNSIK
jgi:hypothetical protein